MLWCSVSLVLILSRMCVSTFMVLVRSSVCCLTCLFVSPVFIFRRQKGTFCCGWEIWILIFDIPACSVGSEKHNSVKSIFSFDLFFLYLHRIGDFPLMIGWRFERDVTNEGLPSSFDRPIIVVHFQVQAN